MRTAAMMLTFLVAIAGVSAASDYIVVLGEDAPASDAVIGANFAASMKASAGVTFSSALDTELYRTITDSDLATKTIVVINGEDREVRILGTGTVASVADTYFSRQGFAVDVVTRPEREDVLMEQREQAPDVAVPETDAAPEDAPAASDSPGSPELPEDVPEIPAQAEPIEPAERPDVPPARIPDPESPGVFTRIWRWFAGLF